MPGIIETRGLCKAYGRSRALDGVSLSVPQGSVFALLGASGAGKTTLIKILMNLLEPSAGEARILDRDTRALCPAMLRQIGYVSENQALPARLRIEHFFEYLRPLYPQWDRALEHELRARYRLPPRRRIGELSHGMRLKMALCCALPFRPPLLLLDEPLSGLDALARDEIIGGFLQQAHSTTIVISSHELDEVERFATHVAFIHEGRLLFEGAVGELAEHARPALTAQGHAADARVSLRAQFVALVVDARQRAARPQSVAAAR